MSDLAWNTDVKLACAGDRDAFARLIRAMQTEMYGMAKSLLHQDEDCADAIQEAILNAYMSVTRLREPSYFRTWLFRIPLSTGIRVHFAKSVTGQVGFGLALTDDAGATSYSFGSVSFDKESQTYRLAPISKGSRSVRIRPFVFYPGYLKQNMQIARVPLNRTPTAAEPIVVPQGEKQGLLVTGIEFLEDRTLVRIRTDQGNPIMSMSRLFLLDENGKSYFALWLPELRMDQTEYTLDFPLISPKLEFASYPIAPLTYHPEIGISLPR